MVYGGINSVFYIVNYPNGVVILLYFIFLFIVILFHLTIH